MPRVATILIAILLAHGGLGPAAAQGEDLKTAHYDLHAEGIDAADTGALLEALHAHLAEYFGKAPKDRLVLGVYSTRERWAEALRADGQPVPEAGGYYSAGTRKAYLFVQPTAYFTRQLILHEATHQFHYLVATGNTAPSADWYTEGLAEFFGMHDWNGATLETGVVPAISLVDYPARALEQFDAMRQDLEGLIAGSRTSDQPERWALVHFLSHTRSREFRRLAAELDQRRDPLQAWRRVFGRVTPRLTQEFRAWIEEHSQPWRSVWIEWQERGSAIEGWSEGSALAVLKSTPGTIEVEIEGVEGETKAGIVFGFQSTDEFWVVQAMAGDRGRVVRRSRGEWSIVTTGEVPQVDGRSRVAATIEGARVRVSINGKDLGVYEAAGEVGLDVEAGRVKFTVQN